MQIDLQSIWRGRTDTFSSLIRNTSSYRMEHLFLKKEVERVNLEIKQERKLREEPLGTLAAYVYKIAKYHVPEEGEEAMAACLWFLVFRVVEI